MSKLKKTYEIQVPTKDTIVYVIEAESKAEALAIYNSTDCPLAAVVLPGWPLGRRGAETSKVLIEEIKQSGKDTLQKGRK